MFSQVIDPRRAARGNFKHELYDIVLLVVTAVLCGADDWEKVVLFGESQKHWLMKYAGFANGIPSHDTVNRVFSLINAEEFGRIFIQWVNTVVKIRDKELIAIDGKAVCNSVDKANKRSALHMVSAFATQCGLCLGQTAVSMKSNEITAIPELLEMLEVKGSIISIDAMGCQRDIARAIIGKGADYLLAVKDNQPSLARAIEDTVRFARPSDSHQQQDCGHGRVETRMCTVYTDMQMIEDPDAWQGLSSIVKIESHRYIKSTGSSESQIRYYISSAKATAADFNHWVRSHWAIENKLHWTLDVVFREDYSRKRKGNAARNFNAVSKIALSLLSLNDTYKGSQSNKRFKALMDLPYREKLLKF
ncbi:MAG: ISAs1 family transposase [Cyclobacteriaceae bacterium]|nr:ISAs1 family transposase [Cyclobacteriaceae bacterium]